MQSNRERILCVDAESLLHPEALGLADENVLAQSWLKVFCNAQEARDYVRAAVGEIEVWVVGCDQMEGINLAAALKRDRPDAEVDLVSFEPSGSLFSRARVAGVTEVMDRRSFLNRYQLGKKTSLKVSFQAPPASQLMPSGMPMIQPQPAENKTGVHFDASKTIVMPKVEKARGDSFVLTIAGAGGGTGKSTIAALCGCYAHGKGRKTVILDADLQFGDIAYLCGCESPLYIEDLVESPLRLEGVQSQGAMPFVIAAPRLLEKSEVVSACFDQLLSLLRQKFEVIVVNTGSNWSDVHVHLLESSTRSLFVLDQRPTSIRACKHALELCSRCGIASQPFAFALNRCSRKSLFSGSDISNALQGAQVFELSDGGRAVEECMGTGSPLFLFDSKNDLAESVGAMMDQILPVKEVDQQVFAGFDDGKRRRSFRRKRK